MCLGTPPASAKCREALQEPWGWNPEGSQTKEQLGDHGTYSEIPAGRRRIKQWMRSSPAGSRRRASLHGRCEKPRGHARRFGRCPRHHHPRVEAASPQICRGMLLRPDANQQPSGWITRRPMRKRRDLAKKVGTVLRIPVQSSPRRAEKGKVKARQFGAGRKCSNFEKVAPQGGLEPTTLRLAAGKRKPWPPFAAGCSALPGSGFRVIKLG
jgi:hypothetical protein